MTNFYSLDDFANEFNVSRETRDVFNRYGQVLLKWQKRINLIGSKTIDDMWRRHFQDSAQLINLLESRPKSWLDFGSGAGFPGMVVALLLRDDPDFTMHLVESNGKKAAFLREVARETKAPVIVHGVRVESLEMKDLDVVSARACSALSQLLDYAAPFCSQDTVLLFPKGQDVDQELTLIPKYWSMALKKFPSHTDPSASIICIQELHRV